MIDTAGTLCKAADFLLKEGTLSVIACATHGVFSGDAFDNLENSKFESIYILDTIPMNLEKLKVKNGLNKKLKIYSSCNPFAEFIGESTITNY